MHPAFVLGVGYMDRLACAAIYCHSGGRGRPALAKAGHISQRLLIRGISQYRASCLRQRCVYILESADYNLRADGQGAYLVQAVCRLFHVVKEGQRQREAAGIPALKLRKGGRKIPCQRYGLRYLQTPRVFGDICRLHGVQRAHKRFPGHQPAFGVIPVCIGKKIRAIVRLLLPGRLGTRGDPDRRLVGIEHQPAQQAAQRPVQIAGRKLCAVKIDLLVGLPVKEIHASLFAERGLSLQGVCGQLLFHMPDFVLCLSGLEFPLLKPPGIRGVGFCHAGRAAQR